MTTEEVISKYRVQQALLKASEEATYTGGGTYKSNEGYLISNPIKINKQSILNAYPLDLIK